MLVDTHCHLGDEQFDADRPDVVERALAAGVGHAVVIADSWATTEAAIDVARRFGLSATAGVHPHEASSWSPAVAAKVEAALAEPVVVAVGETGLDYHYDHSPRAEQRTAFAEQLALGYRHDKPVVVHARSADDDMVAMIRDTDATCILHSFSSGPKLLEVGIEAGAYISFSGMITFRSWRDDDAVVSVPRDRLLIETDAPYLAPTPHRGKRNEPAYVTEVCKRMAEILGESTDDIQTLTTRNAVACFGERLLTPANSRP